MTTNPQSSATPDTGDERTRCQPRQVRGELLDTSGQDNERPAAASLLGSRRRRFVLAAGTSRPATVQQRVPEEFAEVLRDAHRRCRTNRRNEHSRWFDALLLAANTKGWTKAALAEAVGISGERVRQRINQAQPMSGLPEVPHPPQPLP
jgi:hypothetical protein